MTRWRPFPSDGVPAYDDASMKIVIQRVRRASVRVDDAVVASIGAGLLLLLGVEKTDTFAVAERAAVKIANLRIFAAQAGIDNRMDRSLRQVSGEVLVVSQFTLAGSLDSGNRPGFDGAAPAAVAEPVYLRFATALREQGIPVQTGIFGAMMDVELVNDGPVTFVMETQT